MGFAKSAVGFVGGATWKAAAAGQSANSAKANAQSKAGR
jgi:hypothetical protein